MTVGRDSRFYAGGYIKDGIRRIKEDLDCVFLDASILRIQQQREAGGQFLAVVKLLVYDETVDDSKDLEIFDPEATWKTKRVYDFTAKELLVPIFKDGKLVYNCPPIDQVRSYCLEQVDKLWDEVKRFDNPHSYYVDLSQKLWDIKYKLLKEKSEAK